MDNGKFRKSPKNLKKDKSRDPNGLINELFMNEIAGDDLKKAILCLMNRIKREQKYPKSLEVCNISNIWKMKGSKNDFDCHVEFFKIHYLEIFLQTYIQR